MTQTYGVELGLVVGLLVYGFLMLLAGYWMGKNGGRIHPDKSAPPPARAPKQTEKRELRGEMESDPWYIAQQQPVRDGAKRSHPTMKGEDGYADSM